MKQNTRSQQSRINGSKSKGAVTPEGQRKAATASLKHGMYAEESTLDWTIDQEKYDAHRQEIFAIWQPVNNYVAKRVNILAKLIWRLDCLTAFGWDHNSEMLNTQAANLEHMYRLSLEKGSLSERIDAKIRQFNREIRAMEREIDQLQRKFKNEAASQNALKTSELPQTSPGLSAEARRAKEDAWLPEKPQTPQNPSISTGPCYQNSPASEIPGNPDLTNADFSQPEPPDTAPRS